MKIINTTATQRNESANWWKELSVHMKDAYAGKYYSGRKWESLYGHEIIEIYMTEKYDSVESRNQLTVEEGANIYIKTNPRFENMALPDNEWDFIRTDFKAGAEWQKEQGFIRWYSIEKDGLPKVPDTGNMSEELLVWKDRCSISQGYYHKTTNQFIHANAAYWQPTHYAYITYPE